MEYFGLFFKLKDGAVNYSEMSLNFYHPPRGHTLEDNDLHYYCRLFGV
jgi:hypothetical protein